MPVLRVQGLHLPEPNHAIRGPVRVDTNCLNPNSHDPDIMLAGQRKVKRDVANVRICQAPRKDVSENQAAVHPQTSQAIWKLPD